MAYRQFKGVRESENIASVISRSFQSIWMEFGMLFRFIGLMNRILIWSYHQRRQPCLGGFEEKKKPIPTNKTKKDHQQTNKTSEQTDRQANKQTLKFVFGHFQTNFFQTWYDNSTWWPWLSLKVAFAQENKIFGALYFRKTQSIWAKFCMQA